jgi:hypothetical protein
MDQLPPDERLNLIARACDGETTPAERAQLEQLLLVDEAARVQYASFCQMEADLHFQARASRAGRKAVEVLTPSIRSPHKLWSRQVVLLSGSVAASLAAALLLWFGGRGGWGPAKEPAQLIGREVATTNPTVPPANPHENNTPEADNSPRKSFVARIVRVSSDVAFKQPAALADFLLRFKAGEKLELTKGLVQMEFASGAKIIVHGPAVFTPTGTASGQLESGKLRGEVSEGNFRLTTPAAEVIDLGTEFGVQIDSEQSTNVVVFDGKVQVVGTSGNRDAIDMTKGMAARIRSDGSKDYGEEARESQFAKFVPAIPLGGAKNELSVVDIICGGDGFNTSLSGAVDPLTGKQDHGERTPGNRNTNEKYHPVEWNPIVDGVFMPTKTGNGTQINSQGVTIDLPKNNGLTWGPLWARRWESTLQTAGEKTDPDFWGRKTLKNIVLRLKQTTFGMIGMHANVGFTLDLRSVRLLQRDVAEFRAIVTNLDNSEEEYVADANRLKRTADLRVFVDGELRYCRLGFKRVDGDEAIAVALRPEDRFLTVVSSDSEGDSSYDHVVLIDPVIALKSADQTDVPADATARVDGSWKSGNLGAVALGGRK